MEKNIKEIELEQRSNQQHLESLEQLLQAEKKCIESASPQTYIANELVSELTKYWKLDKQSWEEEKEQLQNRYCGGNKNGQAEQQLIQQIDKQQQSNSQCQQNLRDLHQQIARYQEQLSQYEQLLADQEQLSRQLQRKFDEGTLTVKEMEKAISLSKQETQKTNEQRQQLRQMPIEKMPQSNQLNVPVLVLAIFFNYLRRIYMYGIRHSMSEIQSLMMFRIWAISRDIFMIVLVFGTLPRTGLAVEVGFYIGELLLKNPLEYSYNFEDVFVILQNLLFLIISIWNPNFGGKFVFSFLYKVQSNWKHANKNQYMRS